MPHLDRRGMEMSKVTINKIAEITAAFWVLKILATTLGETTGDMLAHTLNLGYAVGLIVTSVILVGLVVSQVRLKTFSPWLFWATIIGTTTVGTEISDFMDRSLGLGYVGGSIVLVIGLALSLLFWYLKKGNIKVDPMTQKFPEIMFWIAVLFSNSLGTAFGDYLSDNLELSYIVGALITASVIAVVVLLHYSTIVNDVILFWVAFIFTRPFGATFGDFLTKPVSNGGLDLGTIESSSVTLVLFSTILYLTHSRNKNKGLAFSS